MWQLIIIVSVLLTSILSGILGMAGGMILMAILVSLLSVAGAMLVHGAVQLTANGSRAWFLRAHIQWQIFPLYLVGATIALLSFWALLVVPNAGIILILIGAFPFIARLTKRLQGLDVTRPITAAVCGLVVTAAQLFAGASGPLLDVFYLNSPLNKQQVVASKAITQALGHLLKLIYYGLLVGVSEDIPLWFYVVAMATAVLGTRIGTRILERFSEAAFRAWSGRVILTIAAACIARGTYQLLS